MAISTLPTTSHISHELSKSPSLHPDHALLFSRPCACRSPVAISTLPTTSHTGEHTHTLMLVHMENRDARPSLDHADPYLAAALEPASLLGCHMIVRNKPYGAHIDSCSAQLLVSLPHGPSSIGCPRGNPLQGTFLNSMR